MNAPWLIPFGELIEKVGALAQSLRSEFAELRAAAVPGPVGPAGERGEKGEPGPAGTEGPAGPPGERGKHGAPGPQGEKGIDGAAGPSGAPGDPGAIGEKGADGSAARDGRDGAPGQKGDPGHDGKDGAPGRDGITPEQLEAAVQKAAAAVIAGIEFDGRTWRIGERTIRTPAPEYRDIYREGEQYAPGDFVTWAGSLWACREATAEKPGEGNPAWRLAAKKGRDGRDGKDGAPAAPKPVAVGR